MTRKKKVRGRPGPKAGFQPAVNLRRAEAKRAAELAKLDALTTGALERMTTPTNGVGLLAALGLSTPWQLDQALIDLTARVRKDPLCRSKELRSMAGGELKAYARGLYVPQHDVEGLSDDKLRQNCLYKVAEILEAITG